MTRIGTARFTALFQQLAQTTATAPLALTPDSVASKAAPRDMALLRSKLQQRLQRLKRESDRFTELAPEITIREILQWELGEQILAHSEFKNIAQDIAQQLLKHATMHQQLWQIIEQMTKP